MILKGEHIAEEFHHIVDDYVRATYGGQPLAAHLKREGKSIAIKPGSFVNLPHP